MCRLLLFALLAIALNAVYSVKVQKEVYNVPLDSLLSHQNLPLIDEASYEIVSVALADERIQKLELLEMQVRFKQPIYMDPDQLKPSPSLISSALQQAQRDNSKGMGADFMPELGTFSSEREFFENARHPLNHILHLQCGSRWFAPMNMTEATYCAEQQRVHAKEGGKESMEYYQRLRKAGVMDDCGLREPGVRPADRDSDDLEALLYSAQPVVIPRISDESHDILRSKALHGAKRAAQPLVTLISLLSSSKSKGDSAAHENKAINFPLDAFSQYGPGPKTGAIEGFTAYFLMSFTAPPTSAVNNESNLASSKAPPRLFRVITPEEAANCAIWLLPTREFPLRFDAVKEKDESAMFPNGRIPLVPSSEDMIEDEYSSDLYEDEIRLDGRRAGAESNQSSESATLSTRTVVREHLSSLTQVALTHAATSGIKHELRAAALAIGLEAGSTASNSRIADPLYALEQAQDMVPTPFDDTSLEAASFIEMESPFIGRTKPLAMDISKTASNFRSAAQANNQKAERNSLLSPAARKRFSEALLARATELRAAIAGEEGPIQLPKVKDAVTPMTPIHDVSEEASTQRLAAIAALVAEKNVVESLTKETQDELKQRFDQKVKERDDAQAHAAAVLGETPIAVANDAESQRKAREREKEYQAAQIESLRKTKLNIDNLTEEEEAILLELEAPRLDETQDDVIQRLEAARERILSMSESDTEFRQAISDKPMQELATVFFETASKIDAVMASGVATEQILSAIADPIVEMVPPVLAEVSMKMMLPAFVEVAKNVMGDSANKFYLPPENSDKMPLPIYTQMHERSLVLTHGMDAMRHSDEIDQGAPGEQIKYTVDFTSKATIASRLLNFLIAEPLRESLDIMHGSLTANMFAHLNRTVTRRAARALSVALTQSLGSQLTRMSLNIFTKAFTIHPAQSLTRILSSTLTNTVALTLTRALTRAPVADIMCELCRKGADDYDQNAEHVQEYCDACWSAEVAGQSQEYYTAYYANYYNWYYTHHYGGYYAKHFAEGYFNRNTVGGYKE